MSMKGFDSIIKGQELIFQILAPGTFLTCLRTAQTSLLYWPPSKTQPSSCDRVDMHNQLHIKLSVLRAQFQTWDKTNEEGSAISVRKALMCSQCEEGMACVMSYTARSGSDQHTLGQMRLACVSNSDMRCFFSSSSDLVTSTSSA